MLLAVVAVAAAAAGYGYNAWRIASHGTPTRGAEAAIAATRLPDLEGMPQALTQWRGKVVVLNFWATWCAPCWEEHPVLNETARAHPEVQFLGVVFQDEEAKIQDFLRRRGAAYPTVIDEGGRTAIAYGVGGVPETFILDANGTIVVKHDGPVSQEQLQAYLAEVRK